MTETDCKRRAIVWDCVEQLAFRPGKKTESWLGCYSKQLRHLLQLDPVWIKNDSQGCFHITQLNIACKYKIESPNAYVAWLEKTEDKRTIWSVHVDADYVSKAVLHMAEVNYPDAGIDIHLRSDIENVLDGMLFHPRNHAHLSAVGFTTAGDIDLSCEMLKANDIRVTGSAFNGFVFLYHIAYQLCVVSKQARKNEKTRLIDLFENAIRKKDKTVNARDLFSF